LFTTQVYICFDDFSMIIWFFSRDFLVTVVTLFAL